MGRKKKSTESDFHVWYRCEYCDTPILRSRKQGPIRFCSKRCQGFVVNTKPERRQLSRQLLTKLNQTPEMREQRKQRFLKMHRDREFSNNFYEGARDRITLRNKTSESRHRSSKWMTQLNSQQHQDPEWLKRKSERWSRTLTDFNHRPRSHRLRYQYILLNALGFPPEWHEFHVDLRSVRNTIENCPRSIRGDIAHPVTRTVIEIDGWYHDSPKQSEKDRIRDEALTMLGWYVLRVRNAEIDEDLELTVCKILSAIEARQ